MFLIVELIVDIPTIFQIFRPRTFPTPPNSRAPSGHVRQKQKHVLQLMQELAAFCGWSSNQ